MTLKTFDWRKNADLIIELKAIIDREKENEEENEEKNEKENEKENETDLIIDLKFSIEDEKLIWSLIQSFRLKMKCWSDHWIQNYRIVEEEKEKEKNESDSWSIVRKTVVWKFDRMFKHSFEVFLFNTLNLLMLCLVILTFKHEHWESNFEINLVLFMKATFSIDRNTKLARAFWHEWWSYFEINSFSYSYDSTTNDDDVIQKK